mmetsp:Transcript_33455/g.60267  ORF Transcript_33455/g.60267 Transcript_33455/m.60267 type:complete len:229 (+) Transcript_33455:303-989(+)
MMDGVRMVGMMMATIGNLPLHQRRIPRRGQRKIPRRGQPRIQRRNQQKNPRRNPPGLQLIGPMTAGRTMVTVYVLQWKSARLKSIRWSLSISTSFTRTTTRTLMPLAVSPRMVRLTGDMVVPITRRKRILVEGKRGFIAKMMDGTTTAGMAMDFNARRFLTKLLSIPFVPAKTRESIGFVMVVKKTVTIQIIAAAMRDRSFATKKSILVTPMSLRPHLRPVMKIASGT